MSKLNLLITGLCSFVPRNPLPAPDVSGGEIVSLENNELTVLMAESGKLDKDAGHSHEMHELHVPVLICPESYVIKAAEWRKPDATFWSTPYPDSQGNVMESELMAIFYLDDQNIEIQPDTNNAFQANLAPVGVCPTGNLESFLWVTPLENVNPGSGKAKKECFEEACHPSVISRLRLGEGTITTQKMATDLEGIVLRWLFEEPKKAHPGDDHSPTVEGQAIAAVVGIEFDIVERIVFRTDLMKRSSSGYRHPNRRVETIFKQKKSLHIGLHLPDGNSEVWVKNMPWLDILQTRPLEPKVCDVHFAHLYKLSENTSVAKKVPCVTGDCGLEVVDRRHAGGTDCPPETRPARVPS